MDPFVARHRARPPYRRTRTRRTVLASVLAVVGFSAAGCGGAEATDGGMSGSQVLPYAPVTMSPAGATLAVLGGIEGSGADVHAASVAALELLERRLVEVGLNGSDLLRVRAALAPGDGSEFAAWGQAWSARFPAGSAPARTTVGSSGLPGDALVVLDAVAVYPSGSEAPPGAVRPTANPQVQLAGPDHNPTAIVRTGNGVFLSAGVLPSRAALENPDRMEEQIWSVIGRLGDSLEEHGLGWGDAFFVRVLPTPQPGLDAPDFAGWEPVRAAMPELTGGTTLPYAAWAAPGFSANGNFVEIEVWATWPEAMPQPAEPASSGLPFLRMSGSPTSQIASAASVGPEADLVWVSGVVAPEGTAPEDEGMAVLDELETRLAAVGAGMDAVAELRVYRVPGESGFNAGYSAHFNNPDRNPHRPARTNYLVEALPAGRTVMVEAVVARVSGTP